VWSARIPFPSSVRKERSDEKNALQLIRAAGHFLFSMAAARLRETWEDIRASSGASSRGILTGESRPNAPKEVTKMRANGFAVLLVSLLATAAAATPPSYTDADILGLEISGSLLAPGATVSQISEDLNAIRNAYPGFVDGVAYVVVWPSWLPGVIIVQMTPQAWADYQNGVFEEFDDLNALYGPVTISPVALPYTVKLEFAALYHPVVLAADYAAVSGIALAVPNSLDGDGSDITSSQVGRYTFKRGWGDCLSGCFYEHFWEFEVTNGNVVLLDEYGDPTLTGVGDTPVGTAVLVGNAPNPFDSTTDVRYHLTQPTRVELRVYDVAGRLVKDLRDGSMPEGAHEATWDGTDAAGHRVPSGVYFCSLVADGVTQSRKMLVLR
jgi:hypothetical protein